MFSVQLVLGKSYGLNDQQTWSKLLLGQVFSVVTDIVIEDNIHSFIANSVPSKSMWCCKEDTNSQGASFQESIEETENEQSGVKDVDVKEWNMTLRENIVCLDEHNVKVKRQKIEATEQIETERREARDRKLEEREKELLIQQHILETSRLELEQERERKQERIDREDDLAIQQQDLDDQEKALEERNSILEIVVRMNENQQRSSLPLRILLEEKEEQLILRQRELEEREFEMDEKNAVLDQKRKVNTFILSHKTN